MILGWPALIVAWLGWREVLNYTGEIGVTIAVPWAFGRVDDLVQRRRRKIEGDVGRPRRSATEEGAVQGTVSSTSIAAPRGGLQGQLGMWVVPVAHVFRSLSRLPS